MEVWKDIKGYDGFYQVSNMGKVRNIKTKRILSQCLNGWKYPFVALCIDGVAKSKVVHRMVAISFVPNPYNKEQVNHKDGNKLNNNATNLEWATQSENIKHAYDNGLMSSFYKGKNGKQHNRSKSVIQYDLNDNYIAEYGSMLEAERVTGIHNTKISMVARGVRNKAGNYKWRFKE